MENILYMFTCADYHENSVQLISKINWVKKNTLI